MVSLSDLGWVYLALLVLFAAAFVAALVVLARQARAVAAPIPPPPPPATSGTLREAMAAPGAVADPYMLRYVVDEQGESVGETISMTPGEVVVKREGAFYALPLEAVRIEDDRLVAREVDWDAAKARGDAWQAEQAAKHEALHFDAATEKE